MNHTKEKYFDWDDAWVFTSLYFTMSDNDEIDLINIIAAGDNLNHSILSKDQIKSSLIKLQKRGLISIINRNILFSDLGKLLIQNCNKTKGGLFSRIDVTFKKLNSNRIHLPFINEYNPCSFITANDHKKSYDKYFDMMTKNRKK